MCKTHTFGKKLIKLRPTAVLQVWAGFTHLWEGEQVDEQQEAEQLQQDAEVPHAATCSWKIFHSYPVEQTVCEGIQDFCKVAIKVCKKSEQIFRNSAKQNMHLCANILVLVHRDEQQAASLFSVISFYHRRRNGTIGGDFLDT